MNTDKIFEFQAIGHIYNDYTGTFGNPRQSGLAADLLSRIVMEPQCRQEEAFRGINEYDRLWLMWVFSDHIGQGWTPTVRPPKLGGNVRKGVFATRAPFRPNPIGLSCVKLERYEPAGGPGPVLWVSGADLMNGTPILDIKPYVPYADAFPEAQKGFSSAGGDVRCRVEAAVPYPAEMTARQRAALDEILAQDPKPGYQSDPDRVYGMFYGQWNVRFRSADGIVTIVDFKPRR